MAGQSWELHWNGATGSWEKGKRTYAAVYRVRTTSALDGPATVCAYFYSDPELPKLGASYAYGNDSDIWAYAVKIDPQRESKHSRIWNVVVSYETVEKDKEDKRDRNGNPTNNPLEFATEVELSKAQYQRPARKVWNLTALPGRPVNTLGAYTNSARVPFSTPLMRDDSHLVLRVTKYMDHFPEGHARQYCDAINSKKYTLHLEFQEFITTFFKHEAKLQNIGGSFNARILQEGTDEPELVKYWRNTYEIHQRDGGWIEEVLDEGFEERLGLGDPDGRGGFIGFKADGSAMDSEEMAAAFPGGLPVTAAIVDPFGNPVRDAVLLDGNGKRLADGAPEVYIKYRTLKEFPMDALQLSD